VTSGKAKYLFNMKIVQEHEYNYVLLVLQ